MGANGRPKAWVEIAPFVWRDRDGQDRLAAQVVDGKPVRWSYDFASPFEVFDRVPAGKSSAWLLPALGAAVGVLLLTFLHWPAAALVRRKYAAQQVLTGTARSVHRANAPARRAVGGATRRLGDCGHGDDGEPRCARRRADWLIQTLEVAGILIFVGAVLASGWHLWLTFAEGRRRNRKLWNLLVFAATLVLLYVAVTFNLMTPSVNY